MHMVFLAAAVSADAIGASVGGMVLCQTSKPEEQT